MRCHLEERRTSYSRYSLEWKGVEECIYIQWEQFHSFSIDRGWQGQSNHCTTVADLNHSRHHTVDSNCISLQDRRQQRMLIAHSRPLLILQDSFCRPPAHTTHHHLPISLLEIWTVVMASSFQINKFLHLWQSPWRIVEWNRTIILSLPTDLIEHSVSSICCDSRVVRQFITPLVPLRPVVGLRLPSNSFILPASLSVLSKTQTPEGALSLCWCSLTLTLTTSIGIW